ncbi:MAG: hypothetical protein HFI64_14405 [Lachnospiraceae bacterium]|nr:hypothetical protein [Lachnospiraceae bacterium]
MRRRLLLAVLVTAVLGMCWGCGRGEGAGGKGAEGETGGFGLSGTGGGSAGTLGAGETDSSENPADADLLLERADLVGSAAEFSGDGCSLIPVHSDEAGDGGGLAWSAAEGYEEDAEKIKVFYGPGCTFQIAEVDILTARASYRAASIEDVKKQTELVLYGTYGEDGSLTAERVYIYRRTEG